MESKETGKDHRSKISKMYSKIICCKVYISESRNQLALDAIELAAKVDPEAVILNKFEDRAYNRVRYTLVSYVVPDGSTGIIYSPARHTLHEMVQAAFAAIDLETHSGAHPRLGVVDHISVHPLGQAATLEDAAQLAKLVASDIGNGFQVPVFLYEAAHPTGKALDTIRRELGYYRPNYMGNQWAGWALPDFLQETPDEGPIHVNRSRGITMIGASSWVDTYNVPVMSTDIPVVRRIAREVSGRGGGLPTVQTLALVHGDDSTEIACMMLDPSRVGADRVQARIKELAAERGLEVEDGYYTDMSQDMLLERYMKLVFSD